jgi:PAS domain S-box-containing protein
MNNPLLQFDEGLPIGRIEELTRRSKDLSPEAREIVDELAEAFAIGMEELQVAIEELNQQNAELIASREELEIQQKRYRDLFDHAPDGCLVTDHAGVILEANPAAENLLGIPKKRLLNKPLILYLHPSERDRFHSWLERLAVEQKKDEKRPEWEMRFQRHGRPAFPAALTVVPLQDKAHGQSGLLWTLRDLTASKRAARRELLLTKTQVQHRETKEANRLLQALIETMPIGTIIADSEGVIAIVNSAGREILGSSISGPVESPNQSFTTHQLDGASLPPLDRPLARAMRTCEPVRNFEFMIRRADGEERVLLSSAAPVLNEAGEVVSGITIFQDITERKRSREVLRKYAYRLQVLRSANEAILTANTLDELLESVLPYVHQLLPCQLASLLVFDPLKDEGIAYGSYARDESLVERNLQVPIDKRWPLEELARGEVQIVDDLAELVDQPELVTALHERDVRSMIAAPLVYKNRLLGTLNLGFRESVKLAADEMDIVLQMAGKLAIGVLQIRQRQELNQYATQLEQKVARRTQELLDSEERFRTLLNESSFGIALLDTEGRIVISNPALRDMTGQEADQAAGEEFGRFIDLTDKRDVHEIYAALEAGTLTKYQGESHYIRADGDVRWHQVTISLIRRIRNERPWLAVATLEDITEQKRIQAALAKTERLAMAGRLGASLAHEISNPLQSVIGCLGLAEEMMESNDEVQRYLEVAMQELERTAGIVKQLRNLSREHRPMSKTPTDMNALLEKTLLLTRKRCQTQSVEVKWEADRSLPQIPVAADRIQQVFLNLVLNAVDAMQTGGRLDISTSRTSQPDGVRVAFSDNGIGIAPDRLPMIFEPFNSIRTEGLGLGLFISRRIVEEEHSGHIEVESRPGEGSTFSVYLPG